MVVMPSETHMARNDSEVSNGDMQEYLSGKKLYGDDLSIEQIEKWNNDERLGYFGLSEGSSLYGYHRLNWFHGFSRIPEQKYRQCLVLGSGNGEDVRPIADRVERFFVVEPARPWWRDEIGGTPATYLEPAVSGAIALPDQSCDLIVVLSVLHHIPNVSAVMRELGRVAKPGGWLVMQEPISSMGDWRRPRRGLTKHERGIPEAILRRIVAENGFSAKYWKPVMTPFTPRLAKLFRVGPYYNYASFVYFDVLLSFLLRWNRGRYHRQSILSKFALSCIFLVAQKS